MLKSRSVTASRAAVIRPLACLPGGCSPPGGATASRCLLFIGFVVGGVFLAWRWPRIVWAHIPAVVYGALVEFAGFTCPLTLLENDLRQHAGEAGYRGGFIAHYLVKVIHPPGPTRGMQIGLGLLVLLVAIIGYQGFLRRHLPGRAWPGRWPMNVRLEHRASPWAPAGGAALAARTPVPLPTQAAYPGTRRPMSRETPLMTGNTTPAACSQNARALTG